MNRICLITEEFAGINKSGGIGACTRGLALHLASLGHIVDVLITDLNMPPQIPKDEAVSALNIYRLIDIAAVDDAADQPVDETTKSHCVYRFLKKESYDVLHFHDWLGAGFYTAMAKRQGSISSILVTHLHGSSEWVRRHSLKIPSLADFELEGLERSQIENSDMVISPSQYLLDWYQGAGVKLPKSKVLNWILPQWVEHATPTGPLSTRAIEPGSITELIFFGRHERRKGFEIFVDAIAALPVSFQPAITFLGRFDTLDLEFTGSYVLRKLTNYRGPIEFLSDMGQKDAINLIRSSNNALCVMPSLVENSPCVVGECFSIKTPFITCDVGGISELISPVTRGRCLINPSAKELSESILRIVETGMEPVISQLDPIHILARWTEAHSEIERLTPNPPNIDETPLPLVSVCITHYERPALLEQAIKYIFAQTYASVEIIIVDDGSKSAGAQAKLTNLETSRHRFPLKVIRSENRYLGAARNLAASHAQGEYILFHDDDNLAEPHEIEAFVKAAINSNADILTSPNYFFTFQAQVNSAKKPKIGYFPVGIGGTFSFFRNRFGDANALIRRKVFEEIGGFTELYGVGWEDWEFFLKAHLKGYHLAVVPEPLFYYRTHSDGMLAAGNPVKNVDRLFQAIDRIKPTMTEDVYRYAMSDQVRQEMLDKTRKTLGRERESDLHLKLMAKDPNSEDARIMLSDLAVAIGRFDDALRLAMKIRKQREKLSVLVGAVRERSAFHPRRIAMKTVYPVDRHDILFMDGWIASKAKGPLHFDYMLVDQEWFELLHAIRCPRADVSAHLNLESELDLGFNVFAQSNDKIANVFQKLNSKPYSIPIADMSSFANVQLPIEDSDASGFVDTMRWLRYFQMGELDVDHDCAIDVETSASSQTAIMWLPGTLELGERLSATRTRFSRPQGLITASPPRLILPSDERSDIAVTQAS